MKLPSTKTNSLLFSAILASISLTGCNVFDPLDSPTNDDQLISAARACFDQGDIACAREQYAKLSKDSADIMNSELAFATLDENGIGMGIFLDAFGGGGGGAGITKLANQLAGTSLNTSATRLAFYQAFQRAAAIKNPGLRGLVRFTTATALTAEIMAEGAGNNRTLEQTDYTASPTVCKALTSTTCATSADCDGVGSFLTTGSDFDFGNTTEAAVQVTPTIAMLNGAIAQINTALGASEIGASGKFGSGAGSFASGLTGLTGALSTSAGARCYRFQMLGFSLGGT